MVLTCRGYVPDKAELSQDKAGRETDKPEFRHDRVSNSPTGGTSAFQSAPPPGGTGGGGTTSAIDTVVERFPPYNEYGDGDIVGSVSASRRAKNVDGGNSGKSRAALLRGSFYP